jgi:hypothetical protein
MEQTPVQGKHGETLQDLLGTQRARSSGAWLLGRNKGKDEKKDFSDTLY